MNKSNRRRPALLAGALVITIIVLWALIGWWQDQEWNLLQWLHWSVWRQYFAANGWNPLGATPLGFLAMAALVAGVGYHLWYRQHDAIQAKRVTAAAAVVTTVLVLVACVTLVTNVAAGAASYSDKTITVVKDTEDMPASLRQLVNQSEQSNGECAYVGDNASVQSCITRENFAFDWKPRVASAAGARIILSRASETDNLSSVMLDTLTYLDGDKWSAIRDGRKAQPIVGVVEWDGSGSKVDMCRFTGDYKLDMAFAGRFGHNLANEIAKRYPNHLFDDSDMWGYCKGDEPVIVISTRTREGFEHVTTDRFGGLIIITGSPSGEPQMDLVSEVKPGEYPGPVYPASVAAQQRQGFEYSAGIINNWFRGFGFETSDVVSQVDNPSEYLLTDKKDGRRYWVTPMQPGSSESQQIVAYSVTPADEATVDQLNVHRLYVLNGDDPAVVDMQRLYNRVVDAVNQEQPAFFTGEDDSKGTLTEFLPTDDGTWQIYAERGGNVVYRVEVSIDDRIAPVVVGLSGDTVSQPDPSLSNESEGSSTADGPVDCDAVSSLTADQIQQCIDGLVRELGSRASQ